MERDTNAAGSALPEVGYDIETAVKLARLVYDLAHPDPGPLCHRCMRPYREWRGIPPCECEEGGAA